MGAVASSRVTPMMSRSCVLQMTRVLVVEEPGVVPGVFDMGKLKVKVGDNPLMLYRFCLAGALGFTLMVPMKEPDGSLVLCLECSIVSHLAENAEHDLNTSHLSYWCKI